MTRPNQPIRAGLLMHEIGGTASVFGRKSDVSVSFRGETAMTDGKRIVLPSLPSNATISPETQAIMRGYLDHEAGHVRHTSMRHTVDLYKRWHEEGKKLHKSVHNALEDIRLERKVMAEYPGSATNLRATATAVNEGFLKKLEDGHVDPSTLEDLRAIGPVAITWRGRQGYGGNTTHTCWDLLPKAVQDAVDEALADLDGCTCTEDVTKIAERIADAWADDPKPDGEGAGGAGEGDEGSEEIMDDASRDDGGKGEEEEEGESEGKSEAEAEGRDKTDAGGEAEAEDEDEPESEGKSESKDESEAPEPVSFEVREALMEAISEDVGDVSDDYLVATTAQDEFIDPLSWDEPRFCRRVAHEFSSVERYTKMLAEMQAEVGVVRRKLERALISKQQRAWVGGLEEGRLDTRRLPAVLAGRTTVFKRRFDASDLDTAVSILIDLSGSMVIDNRCFVAAQCAIALAEALERTTVQYEVVGFQNIRNIRGVEGEYDRIEALDMPVFKGFNQKLVDRRRAMAAIANTANGNNSDACAVDAVWARLRKRGESRKVMLVLSDGVPEHMSSRGVGSRGRRDQALRDAVNTVQAEGGICAGIGIQTPAVRQFYPRHVVVNELSDLGGAAINTLASLLLDNWKAAA